MAFSGIVDTRPKDRVTQPEVYRQCDRGRNGRSARVRHIAQDEGFAVNETKTRVLRQSNRQLVTGVVVNERAGMT